MKSNLSDSLVSIIMPVYNAAPFLEECLNSILHQSYSHWEIIAIDDFSKDSSLNILRAFAQKDARIRVFQNSEKGIVHALKLAFNHSLGAYITRMDADDIMPKDKIKRLAEANFKNPHACITGKVNYFSDSILMEGFLKYEHWLNNLVDQNNHYSQIYKECIVPSPCWMIHRNILLKIKAFTQNTYPEDYDLCFLLYKNSIPIVGIDEVLHLWRDHGTRASRNDPNYANQGFIDLKMKYFLELDYIPTKQLILWGAGKSAKLLAKALLSKNISFLWISNNPNKINHNIYGIIIQSESLLQFVENAQIILAIKEKDFKEKSAKKRASLSQVNQIYEFY